MEKVLSPQVQSLVLSDEEEVSIRGAETVEQVSEAGRSLAMKGFCGQGGFELDALLSRKPVKALEDKGDVVTGVGVGAACQILFCGAARNGWSMQYTAQCLRKSTQ